MSITQHQPEAGLSVEPQGKRSRFGTGRSEFVVVAVLYAVAVFLTIGTATMNVQGKSAPGPQFFPVLVCIVLYLAATLLAIHILRTPNVLDNTIHPGHGQKEEDAAYEDAPSPTPGKTWKTYSDWRTVGLLVGGVVAFVLVLEPLGWIISAAALFWLVAYALGSRRPIFDIGLGLLFSSIIQLAFGAALGLSLPSGLVGGIL
jgi:putative tricarboxylic transport membrane protein